MPNKPALSIIMPSLNVAPYIRQCIESVLGQTAEDIEILCVDAMSTDGTLEILREYAGQDPRVRLILSDKKSYGYQMNLGLDAAQGEYIGIVETDDWVDADMFATLLQAANENDADIVRSNYYWHYTDRQPADKRFENLAGCPYGKVFSPAEVTALFATAPAIWSGIYRRSLIVENGIRFHETPGASYQDTSFYFMLCTVASRAFLLDRCFLHYRRDNENSSVNNSGKVYCICDELRYFEAFLHSRPADEKRLEKVYMALKLDKYLWNYKRLAPRFQWEFLCRMREEYAADREKGLLEEAYFTKTRWEELLQILNEPFCFYQDSCKTYAARPQGDALPAEAYRTRSTANEPDVSIVIRVCDDAGDFAATLKSARRQSLATIEIVCVEDGTETTASDAEDPRFTLLHQDKLGRATARSRGICAARGRYILLLESGDRLREDAAETLLRQAEENKLDLLFFANENAPDADAAQTEILSGESYFSRCMDAGACPADARRALYRRDFLEENALSFDDGVEHADELFCLRCLLRAQRVRRISDRIGSFTTLTGAEEGSFLSLYGYLYTLQRSLEEVRTAAPDEKLQNSLAAYLSVLFDRLRLSYEKTDDKRAAERKLSGTERRLLELVLEGGRERTEKEKATARLQNTQRSASYRLGRLLTWPLRKVRGGVRCVEEHGFGYTLRLALGLQPDKLPHRRARKRVLISVIIPVYNAAPYLDDCIGSLLRQSLKQIEIICVDDGSTDDSVRILEKYQKLDGRIVILRQPNSGAGIARNTGMKIARGKYLSILDADDFFAPDMLKRAYETAEARQAEIVMFRSDWYNHERKKKYAVRNMQRSFFPAKEVFSVGEIEMNFYDAIQGWAWDKLFLRSFVESWQLRFQGTKMYNDMCFTYSAVTVAKRIAYIEDVLLFRRINRPGALTKSVQKNWPSVFEALGGVKAFLEKSGNYDRFRNHFTTYALYMILYTYGKTAWQERLKMRDYFRAHARADLNLDLDEEGWFEKPEELAAGRRAFFGGPI